MKEGLYYKDKRTGEILLCKMFSRSSHVFINENNVCIERPKYNVYERETNKKTIKEFEEKREGKRSKWITEKRIDGWENVLKFNTIYE
jgi:hypothetical protein